ncbi:prepilin-type N-terminal cleavage/methylation domain-containing protein [Haliea atlantica]
MRSFLLAIRSHFLTIKDDDPLGKGGFPQSGFTLIEVVLVILIGGIILSAISSALMTYVRNAELKTTQHRLQAIEDGLQQFLSMNGRLPCAASRKASVDTEDFGREVTSNCSDGDKPGTERVTGRDGQKIRIGVVPTRTINLPDDYAADSWGNRFSYAVTEVLATPNAFDRELGAISVVDSADNSVVTPEGGAHYVVISHGDDGLGAYTIWGVQGEACDTSALDGANCDDTDVFRKTTLTSSADSAAHYDDLVSVRANSVFGAGVPAGALMAFNLSACPPGWVPYTEAGGRTIIGSGEYDESYDPPGRDGWSFNTAYESGDTGGFATWRPTFAELGLAVDTYGTNRYPSSGGSFLFAYDTGTGPQPTENRSPYIAKLYCEKT